MMLHLEITLLKVNALYGAVGKKCIQNYDVKFPSVVLWSEIYRKRLDIPLLGHEHFFYLTSSTSYLIQEAVSLNSVV